MRGLAWWVAWIMVCLPAGALAGLALIEFNLGGGPYDGGFLGYLVLFGGFLALGQSPFLFYFSRALQQHYSDSSPEADTTLGAALGWVLTGFAGWTIGSVVSIGWPGVSAGIEPSVAYLSSRALPWLVMGLLQGGVFAMSISGAFHGRAFALLFWSYGVWSAVTVLGGLLLEGFIALLTPQQPGGLELQEPYSSTVGNYFREIGVAENLANIVLPCSLLVALLYGLPTGIALVAIRHSVRRSVSSD